MEEQVVDFLLFWIAGGQLNLSHSSFLDSSVRSCLKIDRSATALFGAYKSNEVKPTTEEERLDEKPNGWQH
jgi:hypothetical protein